MYLYIKLAMWVGIFIIWKVFPHEKLRGSPLKTRKSKTAIIKRFKIFCFIENFID